MLRSSGMPEPAVAFDAVRLYSEAHVVSAREELNTFAL